MRNKKFRIVNISFPVFVPEKIAKGDRDSLVDYLNYKLYNMPEFFDGFTREDIAVSNETVMGQFGE